MIEYFIVSLLTFIGSFISSVISIPFTAISGGLSTLADLIVTDYYNTINGDDSDS